MGVGVDRCGRMTIHQHASAELASKNGDNPRQKTYSRMITGPRIAYEWFQPTGINVGALPEGTSGGLHTSLWFTSTMCFHTLSCAMLCSAHSYNKPLPTLGLFLHREYHPQLPQQEGQPPPAFTHLGWGGGGRRIHYRENGGWHPLQSQAKCRGVSAASLN